MELLKWVGLVEKESKAYNPVTDGDELSSTIVTGLSKDIRYSRDEKNHLKILL